MTELPEPLTPPECDLRDFAFMPLDVLRLRDSDLASIADAEAFRAAVISWCVAWHQLPAASLPDDDAALCRLLGYGRDIRGWQRIRAAGALRGYVKCADGRLYHPVVAEKAREAWQKKLEQRARTAAAREARLRQKQSASVTEPPSPLSQTPAPSVTDNVTGSKGQGQGQGQGDIDTSLRSVSLPRAERAVTAHFADFWQAYPRKVGKGAAERAFRSAIAKGASVADIAAGLNRQQWPDNPRFVPHPATWLNQSRWLDDPEASAPKEPDKFPHLRGDGESDGFPVFPPAPGSLLQ
jgi:hypothetical protein